MATLIHADGRSEQIAPANGKKFTLSELQRIVADSIDMVPTLERKRMVVGDNSRVDGMPRNMAATLLLNRNYIAGGNYICGPALVLERGEA